MIPFVRLREAELFLHEQIPLTRAMGVRVVEHDGAFAIEAPVALNHNHLQTAFGGSINAVATLAAYTFLWLEVQHLPANVVVRESSIRFHRPIREVIRAICIPPGELALDRFHNDFAAQQKARFELHVRVEEEGVCAAEFVGTFVAIAGDAAA